MTTKIKWAMIGMGLASAVGSLLIILDNNIQLGGKMKAKWDKEKFFYIGLVIGALITLLFFVVGKLL